MLACTRGAEEQAVKMVSKDMARKSHLAYNLSTERQEKTG
jgi:hypothetical protein